MKIVSCPPELKSLYRQGRVIPFVGAGASMSVEWEVGGTSRKGPSWDEMIEEAARIVGVEEPELLKLRGTSLQILEYLKIKKAGSQPLINWLVKEMNAPDEALRNSKTHQALSKLDCCNLYYTTNYDDFIERSLELNGRSVTTVVSEHDLSQLVAETQVVKFHGDFNKPDQMVLSESDYERRMRLVDLMDIKLQAEILGRAVLFLGYSFGDPNVAYLFRLFNDTFGDLPRSQGGSRAFIVVNDPSDFEIQLFRARNIEVIRTTGSDRTASTATLLDEMRS